LDQKDLSAHFDADSELVPRPSVRQCITKGAFAELRAACTVGASLPISGLTAWQGLFQHGRLQAGQSVLAHGAAGAVGSMVTQLAREAGAYVIGTGRAADRQKALDFGAREFVDLDNDALEDVGGIDLVFDVIGGNIQKRSADLIRAGGTLVSIVGAG
jgi:NADPH:quinone reductase-like Zn-dependent oxidoreductase